MTIRTEAEGIETPIDILEEPEESRQADVSSERTGFLPIVTNWFDRLFISVVIWIALSLFWMRFLEPAVPLWVSNVIALALAVVVIRKG